MTFVAAWSRLHSPLGSFPTQICCCPLALLHLTVCNLAVTIFAPAKAYGLASTYAMLCHFCQNLVFVPVEEVSVHNAHWLTDQTFVNDPYTWLISVHQPSRNALELSAGRGCRVCALFWFQLFYDAGAAHTRRDNDLEVAPIMLSTEQFWWDKGYEERIFLSRSNIRLRCGERFASLRINMPVSGIANEHM